MYRNIVFGAVLLCSAIKCLASPNPIEIELQYNVHPLRLERFATRSELQHMILLQEMDDLWRTIEIDGVRLIDLPLPSAEELQKEAPW